MSKSFKLKPPRIKSSGTKSPTLGTEEHLSRNNSPTYLKWTAARIEANTKFAVQGKNEANEKISMTASDKYPSFTMRKIKAVNQSHLVTGLQTNYSDV